MRKKTRKWYPISFTGGMVIGLYAVLPPYIVFAETLGLLTQTQQVGAVLGILFVIVCMIVCRITNQTPFRKKKVHTATNKETGFTLIELLIVISIIGN